MAWLRNRNFESPFSDDIVTHIRTVTMSRDIRTVAMGRDIRTVNCDNERPRADDDWVEKHQRRLRDAHRIARVHLQQHADDRKQRYDRRACDLPL